MSRKSNRRQSVHKSHYPDEIHNAGSQSDGTAIAELRKRLAVWQTRIASGSAPRQNPQSRIDYLERRVHSLERELLQIRQLLS